MSVFFHVPGQPRPQGSKRGFVNQHTGKVAMVESSKYVADWRGDIKRFAYEAMGGRPILEGPVGLGLRFEFERPKSHGKKKTHPISRVQGDVDKHVRSAFDALTSVVFKDDAQVVYLMTTKGWADERGPGLWVNVWDMS